ncbi:MAG: hypothetical protein MUC29_01900 [Pyrinomonadaceae bacterium]|jgi:hypothetical protein|nr:hypothetical protein [Pyrinomonadaceae bacterium]
MKFSINDIFDNQTILSELKNAWIESEPHISGGHEEGFKHNSLGKRHK